MHRIDSLEISGFKSFRNKVRIRFDGDISAIIGPNGCGKSNVCDAFLWVMGEQSARVLRGSRMEDVIFSGTQRYRPLSFAEVTLNLSYVELPGEEDFLAREDLEIQRRLFRDGGSEYYLNGKRCRLLDIHATFEGTGLGFTSYAIIEQGRVQNITASKPLEIRSLIEEAARIVSFKQRKKSALVKLELAQQNLLRIHDLIQEIERGLRSLKVQVQRARRYNFLREKMRLYLRVRFFRLGQVLGGQIAENRQRLGEVEKEIHLAEQTLRGGQEQLGRVRQELVGEERQLEQIQTRFGDVQLNLQRITTSQGYLQEQRQSLRDRSTRIATELEEMVSRLDERGRRARELEQRILDQDRIQLEARARFEETEKLFRERNEALGTREQELENLRRLVFEDAGLLSNLRNQETQLAEQERWTLRQQHRLEDELTGFSDNEERLRREVSESEDILASLSHEMEDLRTEVDGLDEEIEARRQRIVVLQQESASLEKELDSLQHRRQSIEELETRNEFYSDTAKKLIRQLSADPAFKGTLADYLEAGDGFEAVVENFLRSELETIVVDSMELVGKGVEYFRTNRGGVGHFLLAGDGHDAVSDGSPALSSVEGVLGRLVDVLKTDEAGRNLLLRAVPRIETVWLVQDWRIAARVALEHPAVTCLSLDGVAVSHSGRVTLHGAPAGKGVLGYRREKKEIDSLVQRQERELAGIRDSLHLLTGEKEEFEQRKDSMADTLREYQLRRVRQQEEIKRRSEDLERYHKLVSTSRAELEGTLVEAERIRKQIEQIQVRIAEMEDNRQSRQAEFDQCRQEIGVLKEEVARLNRQYSDTRTEFMTVREKVNSVRAELEQLRQSIEDMTNRQSLLIEERDNIATRLDEIDSELAAFDQRYAEALDARSELEGILEDKRGRIDEIRIRIQEEEKQVEALHVRLDEIRQTKGQLDIERTRLESEHSHIEESCLTEFHQHLDQLTLAAESEEQDLDAETAQQHYLEYREKVERMGSVNLVAMEEYEREEERLAFHQAQEKDISESIQSTQEAIEEIDRRSTRLFKETFEQVNANFREMFTFLFGGGFSELRLVDEENLLESGVEIVASPPGKKLQNILLLSGGEKALTALALLLAIFKYRPSPFCLLDEVDAPLDDSNIDRFVSLVKKMSAHTQFILITHNKRTMEIADSIYGVTMEEPGISKVLSVQLKELESVLEG